MLHIILKRNMKLKTLLVDCNGNDMAISGTESVWLPCTKPKKVRFNLDINEEHPVEHIDDFDSELVNQIWYDKIDYDAFKNKMLPIIKQLMKGESIPENSKQTTRGLEYRTRKGADERQQNKQAGVAAVLMEQLRQRNKGANDPVRIAEQYINVTSHCRKQAYILGLKDEANIQIDLDTIRRDMSRLRTLGSTCSNNSSIVSPRQRLVLKKPTICFSSIGETRDVNFVSQNNELRESSARNYFVE